MRKNAKRALALLLCAAMLVGMMPSAFAGILDPDSDAMQVSIDAAGEGAVLLENDGTLPLSTDDTVAVFGRSQIDFVKGGGGSGDVETTVLYDFMEAMDEVGVNYYEPLYEEYAQWCEVNEANSYFVSNPEMPLDSSMVNDAAANADTAVVVIGRFSTEGSDREVIDGDWYLSNSETELTSAWYGSIGPFGYGEEEMLDAVTEAFDNVVVILNTGSMIDLNWVDDYDINAVLAAWQPGSYGAIAIADILVGNVVPSGKLVDTWGQTYEDYPAVSGENFGVDVDDPVYNEDIYVGYRYFETFNRDGVRYPFGYGLSYTTFDQKIIAYSETPTADGDTTITVKVRVTNTGDYAGKDVVQVYYSAPQGELGKAAVELAAYGKTDELAPGESQTLILEFDASSMASYDDSGATGNESCYVLEAGDYTIYAGDSVRDAQDHVAGTYTVDSLVVVEELTELLAPTEAFDVFTTGDQNSDGSYTLATKAASLRSSDNEVEYDLDLDELYGVSVDMLTGVDQGIELIDVCNGTNTLEEFISQLTLAEFVQLFGGSSDDDDMGYTLAEGSAGVMGQTLTDYGVVGATMADGPAGLRLTIHTDSAGNYIEDGNTAFPVATMLACTWNLELLEQMGEEIGKEAALNNVDIWLAPGMNIHRDPLCGRNFEYYSEDPLVSGMSAAVVTKGVQSHGVGVTLKHYAANNQETTRSGGDSVVTERALREIYLKGFEICVKTADPWYVMTSYNQINGSQAASNYELCTSILREEWGFSGSVMTDWGGLKDDGNASMIRAQQDISMPTLGGSLSLDELADYGFEVDSDSNVVCSHCGQVYGSSFMASFGWLVVDATKPCDDPTCTRDVDVTYRDLSDLRSDYSVDDTTNPTVIYDANGEFVCDYVDWAQDRTDLIVGLVDERVTFGELYRSAENLLGSLMQALNFRTENGLGAAPYEYNEDAAPFALSTSDEDAHVPYVEGFADGTFGGEEYITRAQTAAMLYRVSDQLDREGDLDSRFADVEEDDWYYYYVAYLEDQDVIDGYPDSDDYLPDAPITRAEFTKMIVEFTGLGEDEGENPFDDTEDDHWAMGYILRGYNEGWIEGDEVFSDDDPVNFRADDNIFRGEAVKVINRAMGIQVETEALGDIANPFSDLSTADWFYSDVIVATVGYTYRLVDGVEVITGPSNVAVR